MVIITGSWRETLTYTLGRKNPRDVTTNSKTDGILTWSSPFHQNIHHYVILSLTLSFLNNIDPYKTISIHLSQSLYIHQSQTIRQSSSKLIHHHPSIAITSIYQDLVHPSLDGLLLAQTDHSCVAPGSPTTDADFHMPQLVWLSVCVSLSYVITSF